MTPTLGLIAINDVYTLEHLPKLASLIMHHHATTRVDRWLTVVAGDFLAPSLLSSVDAGRHMVACLNVLGVTHAIFGNHEDDLAPSELLQRYDEFQGRWLGTNVRGFARALPRSHEVEVAGVRVGLVGGVMEDPTVYRRAPFGGVNLDPLNDALVREANALKERGCAHVIAITHQWINDDRALARTRSVPLIVGGHEHDPFLETIEETVISKSGSDAVRAAVITVELAVKPIVTVRHEPVDAHPADSRVQRVVDEGRALVEQLSRSELIRLPTPLSSSGARSRQVSMGTFVTSQLREALHAELAIFNGGGLRGTATHDERLTYGDLMEELPFENEIVVVPMPGSVLREAIAYSRRKAPEADGGFMQVDDGVEVASDGCTVVGVGRSPLDDSRTYRVALPRGHLLGLDHNEPLQAFGRANGPLIPAPGIGRPPRLILLDALRRAS